MDSRLGVLGVVGEVGEDVAGEGSLVVVLAVVNRALRERTRVKKAVIGEVGVGSALSICMGSLLLLSAMVV